MLFSRFDTESSLWGPFLSVVNEEQARQSDRRYWSLSSDGTALTEGGHTLKHSAHITFSAGSSHFNLANNCPCAFPQVPMISRLKRLKRSPSRTKVTE